MHFWVHDAKLCTPPECPISVKGDERLPVHHPAPEVGLRSNSGLPSELVGTPLQWEDRFTNWPACLALDVVVGIDGVFLGPALKQDLIGGTRVRVHGEEVGDEGEVCEEQHGHCGPEISFFNC